VSVVVVTGSAGLIGSETVRQFANLGHDVIGIDNDLRSLFFGSSASTRGTRVALEREIPNYRHHDMDIRNRDAVFSLFAGIKNNLAAVIHTAAQPSHDWAARDPIVDFEVNAVGTLNLLEATRRADAAVPFVFTSTNKVYGDRPNAIDLVELPTRWEVAHESQFASGIDETMSIDSSMHSVFGASKVAADVMVQEYGRYFGMPTVVFRGGTLTGTHHAATELHGFLAYLFNCTRDRRPYTVFGYSGKQVRDVIHATDVVSAIQHFVKDPGPGYVFNLGGGRFSNCSVLEAITLCEEFTGHRLNATYVDEARRGDHKWWISNNSQFCLRYPAWRQRYGLHDILEEMAAAPRARA
jgi:CDP-paratose 2-epimerase